MTEMLPMVWKLNKSTLPCYFLTANQFIAGIKIVQSVTLWAHNVFNKSVFAQSQLLVKYMD